MIPHELKGSEAAKAICSSLQEIVANLRNKNVIPTLAIVRVGSREDDVAYEQAAIKRFNNNSGRVLQVTLKENCTQEELEKVIMNINRTREVHGVLVMRPLPKHLNESRIKGMLNLRKDVDCMTYLGQAGLFMGEKGVFTPCTPQAVIELIDYFGIDVSGKKVTIVGRSQVVGKPLAIMLMNKNATVTVCHTKTADLRAECKNADIIVACAGKARMIDDTYVSKDQIIIDVGINMADGVLCGDVDYDKVAPIVSAITPVPGGVGALTTSVLFKHTVLSADRS